MKKASAGNTRAVPGAASRFVYFAAAISALGGFLFGYDTGVVSGAILFVRQDFSLSPTEVEVVISSVLLGALLGAVAGGPLADRFGRRRVIIVAAALFAAGAIATGLAPTLAWLIAGRVVVGVAIGIASFTTPLYISEVSPVAVRGRLVSLNQLALTVGIVLSYLIDYMLAGVHAWRWMFGLAAVPAAALCVGMIWLPPSPRWLLARNRGAAAQNALRRIRGLSDVSAEMAEIRLSLAGQSGGWTVLSAPAIRPALIVGVGLAGMVAGLVLLGLAFALPRLSGSLGVIAIGSLSLYVGAIGLGPVFWLLISEIYPPKIRGVAMSFATTANWGTNLLGALTFLILIQLAGRALTFWIYAAVGIGAWLLVWFLVPETKGKSLERIEAHWRAGKHPRARGREPLQ